MQRFVHKDGSVTHGFLSFQWCGLSNGASRHTGTDGWMDTRGVGWDLFRFSFALGVLHPIAVNSLSEACAHMGATDGGRRNPKGCINIKLAFAS